ncbi:MAG TPA: GTPase Era [Polyangiaceae bacterium]|jgi:GTP-binding protein Era
MAAKSTSGRAFHAGRVALVGRPNVGKSTLLNVAIGEKIAIVSQHPQTTRQRLLGVLTAPDSQIVFVDAPGLQLGKAPPRHRLGVRMQNEALEALRDADLVLVVADARTEPDAELLASAPKGAILALNKVDLVKPRSDLLPRLEAWGKAHDFAAIVPISAKTKSGVERLVKELRERLPEGDPMFEDDTLTDKPVRFMVAEFVREQILVRTRQEVPHGIAVTVDRFDELGKKRGVRVALTVHVPKDSHKKIVVGKGGEMLKAVGTAARRELSRLLDTPVHLAIWVRVTPDWVDDPKALGDLGYES